MAQLFEVPSTINFPPPHDKEQIRKVKITNTTEYLISFKFMAKILKRFKVPNRIGILKPGEAKEIAVHMRLEKNGKLEDTKLLVVAFRIRDDEKVPTEEKERSEYCKKRWKEVQNSEIRRFKILVTFLLEGDPVLISPQGLAKKDKVENEEEEKNEVISSEIKENQVKNLRFFEEDGPNESNQALAPLVLLRKTETPVTFREALEIGMGDKMDEFYYEANMSYADAKYDKLPEERKYNLSKEEFYSIFYYTAQWTQPLYSLLNTALSAKDRTSLVPQWKHYLHYLFSAMRKLPMWQGKQDLYRGVPLDLAKEYPNKYKKGEVITWYSFSSTTTSMEVIESFLPSEAPSTIFMINNVFSGRSIQEYSMVGTELEILLPPGSRFEIIYIKKLGTSSLIQMKQIPTLEKILQLE